jgi:hypothetical protein
MEGQV